MTSAETTGRREQIEQLLKAATRSIPGVRGYAAREDGAIISVTSNWRGYGTRALAPIMGEDGYLRVRVVVDGRRRKFSVHRLIALAFHGHPSEGQEVRHLNGSRVDNWPANLAWGTRSENARDRSIHGTERAAQNGRLSAPKRVAMWAARRAERRFCMRGHALTPENTRVSSSGSLCCKECPRNARLAKKALATLKE